MANYLTDEEKAVIANADEHDIPLLPPKVVKEMFGKLLQELEDLKAELFNGISERFRESDARAHRQARIIAVAKEVAKEALRTIAEIEGEK